MNTATTVNPASGPTTPTMKLFIDTTSHRILFAEAGKDVVDFLVGVLAMPVGALASMLLAAGDDAALGGIGSLYASVEKMDAAYMQDPSTRDQLAVNTSLPSGPSFPNTCSCSTCMPGHAFPPLPPPQYVFRPSLRPPPPPPPARTGINLQPPAALSDHNGGTGLPPLQLYRCHAFHSMGALQGSTGFVQGVATYTVMDDLAVAPTTNISSIALLNKLGVKDIDALEERTVSIGRKECLEILKVSLRSKTVLTDVFLPTNKRARTEEEDKNW
ncbi:hypothetical protein PR202_gb26402 [Eleusine coracana subsp. coracana]|uniref:Uncharacterized protein n=1 Tax=Eleusine coracana subsp. coracana TaxID=191504 RepID=A0AAV5FRR1_ELECO|nr:hypothetical protein QOZ80_1BG0058710 [Eleusine coracana subsp. coracana]GJN37446.1 hypothetical protein PR202_gb26402 [Eleusine coracana subsp. coracana]